MPIARLLIRAAAIIVVVPLLVEPTVPNILALSAGLGLALAYMLKDYGSSYVAGLVTELETLTSQVVRYRDCAGKAVGTHHKVKAYVKESREQFLFITDLTVRSKDIRASAIC